jgi:hypothetical protein
MGIYSQHIPGNTFKKVILGVMQRNVIWNTKGEQNCLVNPIHNCQWVFIKESEYLLRPFPHIQGSHKMLQALGMSLLLC